MSQTFKRWFSGKAN